jgi:hypothetical protein
MANTIDTVGKAERAAMLTQSFDSAINDPAKAGKLAGRKLTFGLYRRYAVYPVHTRFDRVCWMVADADIDDNGMPGIIRQEDTPQAALAGFVFPPFAE